MYDVYMKYMIVATMVISHLPLSCPALTRASQPKWCIRLPYLIFSPLWGFFVNGCSFPLFIDLNSRQVRRIPQISYQALASHRETIKPWNMCLAVSQGGSACFGVGTSTKMQGTQSTSMLNAHMYTDMYTGMKLSSDTAYWDSQVSVIYIVPNHDRRYLTF